MNRIIFEWKFIRLKVRDIVILVVIFLVFFAFILCQKKGQETKPDNPEIGIVEDEEITEKEKEERIKDKLNDICGFTKSNINDFNYLLNRVDLCNADWFEDLDLFIKRIKEQNEILKDMTDKNSKVVYAHQEVWVKEIIKLKDEQSKENIELVEKVFKEYKKYYEKTCIKGSVGG